MEISKSVPACFQTIIKKYIIISCFMPFDVLIIFNSVASSGESKSDTCKPMVYAPPVFIMFK